MLAVLFITVCILLHMQGKFIYPRPQQEYIETCLEAVVQRVPFYRGVAHIYELVLYQQTALMSLVNC